MSDQLQRFEFRFAWIERPESDPGKLRETGSIDSRELRLGSRVIPESAVIQARRQQDQLTIEVDAIEDQPAYELVIQVHDDLAKPVLQALNYGISRRIARAEWIRYSRQQGDTHLHQHECGHCRAVVVLRAPLTPQVYCPYCDTIQTLGEAEEFVLVEREYRLCQRCQMYSRPRNFTIFFFYFLLYFGGIHHKKIECCPGCFRKTAWMMCLGNLPFILGIPNAILQFHRCYFGSIRKGLFRGLHDANRCLRGENIEAALSKYEEILERHPLCAGVKYNVALGLMMREDYRHVIDMLELALQDCQNYLPAQELLVEAYLAEGQLNRAEAAAARFNLSAETYAELLMVHSYEMPQPPLE